MSETNYKHLFCRFCDSPMDDDDFICNECVIRQEREDLWWESEREWYVLKDDGIEEKYLKERETNWKFIQLITMIKKRKE